MIFGNEQFCANRFHVGDKIKQHIVIKGKHYPTHDKSPYKDVGVIIRIQENENNKDYNNVYHWPCVDFDPTGSIGRVAMMEPRYVRVVETVDGRVPIEISIPANEYDVSYNLEDVNEKLNCQLPDGSIVPMTKAEYDVALASYLKENNL